MILQLLYFIFHFQSSSCSLQESSNCPEGWKTDSSSSSFCYKFFPEKTTQPKASTECQKHEGNLVSIHDKSMNNFVKELTGGTWAWIGGYRTGRGKTDFSWTDGSPWDFTAWAGNGYQPSNPSENCVQTNFKHWSTRLGDGEWNDLACNAIDFYKMGFVCQKKKSESLCLPLRSESSCPVTTVFYLIKCSDKCLITDCNVYQPSPDVCLDCLENCSPTNCPISIPIAARSSCPKGENCVDTRSIGSCRTCILNIFVSMVRCVGRSGPRDISDCMLGNVYSHCKVCVCWAVCRFGMTSVCNCCRQGQCE